MQVFKLKSKLTWFQILMLAYFVALLVIGLPLALWSVKRAIEYRSQASKVTITAAIPHTPFNTPNYAEVANKPPEILAANKIHLSPGDVLAVTFSITDPDWVKGQKPPQTKFSSSSKLPEGLKIMCSTKAKTKTCQLMGTVSGPVKEFQLLKLTATDTYGASTTNVVILQEN